MKDNSYRSIQRKNEGRLLQEEQSQVSLSANLVQMRPIANSIYIESYSHCSDALLRCAKQLGDGRMDGA